MMETAPQMFLLGNQPMPVQFAGKESFRYSETPRAYTYLLISADTSDGVQELFLYQKKDGQKEQLLARRKLPVSFRISVAQKLTGVIFQQVWYCRQNPDAPLESFLREFSKLFIKSELSTTLLKQFSMLCTQQQISYDALYQLVSQLLNKCEWNQEAYKTYLAQKMKHHPMRILYKSLFVDWLNFCQLAADFLAESKEWKTDDYPMLSFVCYGSAYMTAQLDYISPQRSEPDKKPPIIPEKNADIFKYSELIFQTTQQNMKGFMLRVCRESYETQMIRAYSIRQKELASKTQSAIFPIYAEKALCFPSGASIHVGKWEGLQRPVDAVSTEDGFQMPAPLSEEFSALVASGKAKIISQSWSKQPDGWLFHMEYTYGIRDASNPYKPVDKYYSQEQLIFIDKFPEILVTQKKGQKELRILAQQNACSVGMSNAVSDGKALKLTPPEKMPYHYMLYFKLFDSNQTYLGQFACDLTPKEGGNA